MTTPALLLDRDGVINVDHGYVWRAADFEFMPGIFDLGRAAHGLGWRLVVITNQAGIGRGLYTEADFETLTGWMRERFAAEGAALDGVYHCPTHPTAGRGPYRVDSTLRKPGPGMILQARAELGLDLRRSVLVGDKDSDIAAGLAAGVGLNLLLSGRYPSKAAGLPRTRPVADLAEATRELLAFGTAAAT
jgi:D-glycero-D-manno-heptose 1,7-bisphosphate phosphatase